MPLLYRLLLLITFGTVSACSSPASHPEEVAPDVPPLSESKDQDSGPPLTAEPSSPGVRTQAPAPLEEITPGTFSTKELQSRITVFSPFEVPFANIDRELGTRIEAMYKASTAQGWKKDGPALVAVRGSIESPTVSAEITFTLSAAADGAEKFDLKTGTLPGGLAVIGMHKGSRVSLPETNKALDEWCVSENKKPRGDLRWFVFLNRPDQVSESELLTAVIQPIE